MTERNFVRLLDRPASIKPGLDRLWVDIQQWPCFQFLSVMDQQPVRHRTLLPLVSPILLGRMYSAEELTQ